MISGQWSVCDNGARKAGTDCGLRTYFCKGRPVSDPPLICIIDDDDSLRAALVGLVRSVGYEARGFTSAEAFLQSGEISACACLVTDIQMPGMSGVELKEHLSSQQIELPVIMITGRPDPSLEGKARAAGAAAFMKKPFDASALIGYVDKALGK
jgi:FixJ family two-component response regulator